MSGLGNFLAGAVQGVGASGASLSGKYIDDELVRNRQQAFLDMQRASSLQQAKDMDEFQNDPNRRENLRVEASKDAAAASKSALQSKIEEATSPELQGAIRANDKARAEIPGQVAAEQTIANGANKKYLGAIRAITAAQHFTGPGEELARFQLQQQKQLADIRNRIAAEQDPTKREELQRQEAAITGNTRSDKELSLALAQTVTAMERANKVLADPMADAEAKDSARESIAALKASANHLSRKLGIEQTQGPGKPKEVSGSPWTKFQTAAPPQDQAPRQQTQSPPSQQALPAAQPTSTRLPDQKRASLDASWNGARERLEPLVQQYISAKEQIRRAAASGDQGAINAWKDPVAQLQAKLRSEAEKNLGMYADDFLKSVEER